MTIDTLADASLVAAAGAIGGIATSMAGGATFFTFPALVAAGLSPVTAVASNTVGLWPANLMAVPSYAVEIGRHRSRLLPSAAAAFAGGLTGALLLYATSERLFSGLVPWLLLVATLLYAAGPRLQTFLQRFGLGRSGTALAGLLEFVLAVYGGYFGAGYGIVILALLGLQGIADALEANAVKNVLTLCVTAPAAACFVATGLVDWRGVLLIAGCSALGGLLGARLARVIGARALRSFTIAIGAALTLVYFYRVYGA